MKFYETKLIVKAKELNLKDFIDGTYKINKDGTIDVDGHVGISKMNLKRIPWNLKNVTGILNCRDNKLESLATLETAGELWCENNKLTSLGNLKSVGYLSCYNNAKNFTEEEIRKTVDVKGKIRT